MTCKKGGYVILRHNSLRDRFIEIIVMPKYNHHYPLPAKNSLAVSTQHLALDLM